jgi:hypothetical protein
MFRKGVLFRRGFKQTVSYSAEKGAFGTGFRQTKSYSIGYNRKGLE